MSPARADDPPMWRRLLRVLAVVLVFVAVGPPVGGLVFMPAVALAALGSEAEMSSLLIITAFGLIYAVPFSYFIGALPAALTGCFVGVWLAFYGRMTLLPALATGAGAGFLMASLSDRELLFSATGPIDRQAVPIMASCLVATVVCWLIVRGWYFSQPVVIRRAA